MWTSLGALCCQPIPVCKPKTLPPGRAHEHSGVLGSRRVAQGEEMLSGVGGSTGPSGLPDLRAKAWGADTTSECLGLPVNKSIPRDTAAAPEPQPGPERRARAVAMESWNSALNCSLFQARMPGTHAAVLGGFLLRVLFFPLASVFLSLRLEYKSSARKQGDGCAAEAGLGGGEG